MARPRRDLPERPEKFAGENGVLPSIARAPAPSSAAESELDEFIHMGEAPAVVDDLFDDLEVPEVEEPDAALIPQIERDTKLEEEIEREKALPIEKLVEDVPVQSLDPVRMYLTDIGRHALLNSEEELELARRIKVGVQAKERLAAAAAAPDAAPAAGAVADAVAAEDAELDLDTRDELELAVLQGKAAHSRLAQSNLRLVVSVAKRYIGRGLNFLDLIQEGNLGLLRAVDKFDHTLGYKFSTYATWWIKQAISRAIADQARTIRIPVHMVETINRQARIQRRLQQELGREPSHEELALEMEFMEPEDTRIVREAMANERRLDEDLERRLERASAKVRKIQRLALEPLSLETPVGNEETSSLGDFIEDDSLPGPVDTASRRLLREQMTEILDGLNERERKVLIMRFGLEDGIPRTLEDVGKEFQVTRERVRQIEAKALRKLRHPLRSRKLRDFLA